VPAQGALLAELQALGFSEDGDAWAGGAPDARPDPKAETKAETTKRAETTKVEVDLRRRGGAGPSDHRAVVIGGTAVMVPLRAAGASPFRLRVLTDAGTSDHASVHHPAGAIIERDGQEVVAAELPSVPRFHGLVTADGIPYSKIALLHAPGVLASTVMQSCVRYNDPVEACGFCAIGTSMQGGRTIARKTPAQLAEVAEAAVRLDGVEQLVLTTGTPASPDRGAAHLAACVAAIKAAVPELPVQVQCEPPEDFAWFGRLKAAGVDSLGMHLEAVEPAVRARVMPGKATVSVSRYFEAFAVAVEIFGRGQVSSYLIVGLGDSPASLVEMAGRLLAAGVYPFVVPFVPIAGAPMARSTAAPSPELMHGIYGEVAQLIRRHGVWSRDMKAGCGKCGACSALGSYEEAAA
jgi:radical SAM protein (TIGR04043 family)